MLGENKSSILPVDARFFKAPVAEKSPVEIATVTREQSKLEKRRDKYRKLVEKAVSDGTFLTLNPRHQRTLNVVFLGSPEVLSTREAAIELDEDPVRTGNRKLAALRRLGISTKVERHEDEGQRRRETLEERRKKLQALVVEARDNGELDNLPDGGRIALTTKYLHPDGRIRANIEVAEKLEKDMKKVIVQEWHSLRRLSYELGKTELFKESKSFRKMGFFQERRKKHQALVVEARDSGELDNLPDGGSIALTTKYLHQDGRIRNNTEVARELNKSVNNVNSQEWTSLRILAEKLGKTELFKKSKSFRNRTSNREKRVILNRFVRAAFKSGHFSVLTKQEKKVISEAHLTENGPLSLKVIAANLGKNVITARNQEATGVRKLRVATGEVLLEEGRIGVTSQ